MASISCSSSRRTAKATPRALAVEGHGFYEDPVWAPDSQKISYTDNSQSIYWVDLQTGKSKKVASQQTYTPASLVHHAWSPDSKWLAYTIGTQPLVLSVSLYSVEQDKSFAVTDGLAEVTEPVFDRNGKYLYFFGSTDAGPLLDWFAQSGNDMRETRNVYLVVLRKDLPSPLAKESDEEKEASTDARKTKEKDKDADDRKPPAPKPDAPAQQTGSPAAPHGGGATDNGASKATDSAPFRVDLEDIQFRILDLPIPAANLSNLQAGGVGQIYFLREVDDKTSLQRFDLEKRKAETLIPDVADYRVSGDSKKLLYKSKDSWFIVPTTQGDQARGRQNRRRVDRGEGRSARRVERRSSTKRGAPIATTSTTRACTAWTGRRRAPNTRRCCPA